MAEAGAEYEAALALRGIHLRGYVAPGHDRTTIVRRLTEAGLGTNPSVVEWFEYCGGVRADAVHLGPVFQGRGLFSIDEALADRDAHQDPEWAIDFTDRIPLNADHPVTVVHTHTGAVGAYDVELGRGPGYPSTAEWLRGHLDRMPEMGPHPFARSGPRFTFMPGSLEFHMPETRWDAFHRLGIARTWIQAAPLLSIPENNGLEPEQTEVFRSVLLSNGLPVGDASVELKDPDPRWGRHHVQLWYTMTRQHEMFG